MATKQSGFWGSFSPSDRLKDRLKRAGSSVTHATELAINPPIPTPDGDGYELKAQPATNVPVTYLETVLKLNPVHYYELNDAEDPLFDFMGRGSGNTKGDGIFGEPGLNEGTSVTLPPETMMNLVLSGIHEISPISVSFYMEMSAPSSTGYILTIPRSGSLLGVSLDASGILVAEMDIDGATPTSRSVSSLAAVTGSIKHIIITDDGVDVRMYVDGVEQ